MFKVKNFNFASFSEVVDWAYDTYKLELDLVPMSDEERHAACAELESYIDGMDDFFAQCTELAKYSS